MQNQIAYQIYTDVVDPYDNQKCLVYEVNQQFFRIYYRTEPVPISQDMIKSMWQFAEEENAEDSHSSITDLIPFDVWSSTEYLAY